MIATAPIRGRRSTRTSSGREFGRAGVATRTGNRIDRSNRFTDVVEAFRETSREDNAVKELERRRNLSGE